MLKHTRQSKTRRHADDTRHTATARRGGFTLLELMVVLAIIGILIGIAAFAFSKFTERNLLGQAKNAVLTYAKIARSYAITNHVETLLVVNPYNGRFEIWHQNPPVQGGLWDPTSSGAFVDGYTFAPVLDSSARLPIHGNGQPIAYVHPIDYDSIYRELADNEQNLDNLTWAAVCFDEKGKVIIRSCRIATRSFFERDGSTRANPNRTIEETPNLALSPLVTSSDTLITSTTGFVISEWPAMKTVISLTATPADLVNEWLKKTQPGEKYHDSAEFVVLNRATGQALLGVD